MVSGRRLVETGKRNVCGTKAKMSIRKHEKAPHGQDHCSYSCCVGGEKKDFPRCDDRLDSGGAP